MKTGAIPDGGARKASSPAEPRLYGGRTLAQCCEFAGKLRRAGFHETPSIITDLADEIEKLQAEIARLNALARLGARLGVEAVRKLDAAIDENQELYRRLDAIEAQAEADEAEAVERFKR